MSKHYIYILREHEIPYKFMSGTSPYLETNRIYLSDIPYRAWKKDDLNKYQNINDWIK